MKFQFRDGVTFLLAIALMASTYYSYTVSQARDSDNKAHISQELQLIGQIKNLRDCIDNNTRPCDIDAQHPTAE